LSRIWLAAFIVLVLAGFAGAVPPWNFEGKSLTPQQIQALAMPADSVHSYDVRFYRLDISLPMTNDAMTAHERISIASRIANLDTFSLNMDIIVCDSVKQGPTSLTFTTPANWLTITLNSTLHNGDSTDLDIFFHLNAGTSGRGFEWHPGPPATICFTFTEPSDSRYWFPCWDEPWDKAERGCQINVTIPDTFLACSNGLLDSVTADSSARTKTFWWTEHFPIATYLMTFTASRVSTWKQRWARAPGDTIDVKYYIWTMDSTYSVSAFANVPDMLSFFSRPDVYVPYPFEKYGIDAVTSYAMENQTMTMLCRPQNCVDELIAHELSHQWWGDMVTCFTWGNIWLNEGFANYSAALYMEHQQGHAFFIADLDTFANWYFSEDSGQRFPMYNPPSNKIFSATTYCKGAWVQHMLRYVMSDTSATHGLFFTAQRTYADSFKYRNVSTADYQRVNEHIFGQSLAWFFDEWAYQAGYPQYHVNWYGVPESSNWRIIVDISQSNGNGAPPVFHMPVEILFHLAGKDTLVHYPINSSPQRNEFVVSVRPDSAVFDPSSWILKKVSMTNVGVETGTPATLLTTALFPVHPNPFRGSARIEYALAAKGRARLSVYNVAGQMVRELVNEVKAPGRFSVSWDGRDQGTHPLPSGVYLYRFQVSDKSWVRKAVLLR